MEIALFITHCLFMLFLGLIVGGAIAGKMAMWLTFLILLNVDIIVGIVLQYIKSKSENNANYNPSSNKLVNSIPQKEQRLRHCIIKIETPNAQRYQLGSTYHHLNFGNGKVVGIGIGYLNVDFFATTIDTSNSGDDLLYLKITTPTYNTAGIYRLQDTYYYSKYFSRGTIVYLGIGYIIVEFNSLSVFKSYYKVDESTATIYYNLLEQPVNVYIDDISFFNNLHSELREDVARVVTNAYSDEVCMLLFEICTKMKHAPTQNALTGIAAIAALKWDGFKVMEYAFNTDGKTSGLIDIYLVKSNETELRFFTIEKNAGFCLCEYKDDKHINYGPVDILNVEDAIIKILK